MESHIHDCPSCGVGWVHDDEQCTFQLFGSPRGLDLTCPMCGDSES